ncbi:amidase [Rathayibacter oskolensis]|uniref:Amidase n=1 Tax=Rathayibacter oskolensis TaxID=1891671 RepID=A0A1X7P1M5_9MICO|nr:amidase family protein [Rathayibacter oskolensis]SMH44698.1 amidase [Rathayibacter oskolensis]
MTRIDPFSSIAELRAALAAGEVSAVEVAADRLAAVGEHPTTVVAHDPEAVLRAAASVDERRRRGEPLGPLAGVPITVKDAFEVEGLVGSVGTAGSVHRSGSDAPAVAALRAADAVILGKTNVPAFLATLDTANDVYGRTPNPWGAGLSAGGSSGGSAAAVASGLSWGDLGSDLVGSIRVPAAWNGVCGHRPSNGVISKRGHLPWRTGTRLEPSASVAGPIARSADDTAALFEVLAGTASPGPWRLALPAPRFAALGELRVGLWLSEESAPIDDETAEALEALADRLGRAVSSVRVIRDYVLATADAEQLFDRLVQHEIAYGAALDGTAAGFDTVGDPTAGAPAAQVWADLDAQIGIRDHWHDTIADVDVVLAPTVPSAAPMAPVASEGEPAISRWSNLANLAMGPSTVLPIGLGSSSGLPIAAQLIGAHGHDLSTLSAARLLADAGLVPRTLSP